jgi:hypothetical protein
VQLFLLLTPGFDISAHSSNPPLNLDTPLNLLSVPLTIFMRSPTILNHFESGFHSRRQPFSRFSSGFDSLSRSGIHSQTAAKPDQKNQRQLAHSRNFHLSNHQKAYRRTLDDESGGVGPQPLGRPRLSHVDRSGVFWRVFPIDVAPVWADETGKASSVHVLRLSDVHD